jgi:ACR3 family arsenite efflux pump ArsB
MTEPKLSTLEKLQSVFILASIAFGLMLSYLPPIAQHGEKVILPALMLMLYYIFLQLPLQRLKTGFTNLKVVGLSLAVNFILTPLIAFGLGYLFLSNSPELWVGFFMLMLTPCTDWYLVFIGMARGDVGLGLSLLPWNLLLQLALLPVYLAIFAGSIVPLETMVLVKSVVFVFILPFSLAYLTRYVVTKVKDIEFLEEQVLARISNYQFIFLLVAITGMFASQGKAVIANPLIMVQLLAPILLFFMVIYFLAQFIGRLFKFTYPEVACFTCTTAARNSPIALAIAVTAFPDQPLIALVLVIGPFIELPMLFLITRLLLKKACILENK